MTKEQMTSWLKQHKHIETRGDRDFLSPYAEGCIDGYEYAEMNFKTRTCEDCKHMDKQYTIYSFANETHTKCMALDTIINGLDFGYNKFERREDE